MTQLHVESWAAEYGTPFDSDPSLAEPERVDDSVEVGGPWDPIAGFDDGIDRIAFVDGVRRVDARLTIDDPQGLVPGLCGSYAVGAVTWDRTVPRSDVTTESVDRMAVFGSGKGMPIPVTSDGMSYRTESVPTTDPASLIARFHGAMRRSEGELAQSLVRSGVFVIGDGPINDVEATDKVGFIKTHRVPYLSRGRSAIIGRLAVGERTPLFVISKDGRYERYSWYCRIGDVLGGHSWSGVARGEVSAALELVRAQQIADRATAIIPLAASESHIDPRAPQNLVPIAALERSLRRLLGDPGYVYRQLRSTIMTLASTGVS